MDTSDRDRMITVGELSSILAHEIKNPMNSIIINLEVLRNAVVELTSASETPTAARAKRYLEAIEGEIRRLDRVIKGFLDFANPAESTRIKFKINNLIQECVDFMANEMNQKGIRVVTEFQTDLAPILGSPDQVKQAVFNLMINALQSIPSGGSITIKTFYDDSLVKLSIRDTGLGIPQDLINKIFTPYFTTKEKSSGLGLSIVRRIVRDHGGDVFLTSEVGQGTEFVLSFPKHS